MTDILVRPNKDTVEIIIGSEKVQLTPDQARELAGNIDKDSLKVDGNPQKTLNTQGAKAELRGAMRFNPNINVASRIVRAYGLLGGDKSSLPEIKLE